MLHGSENWIIKARDTKRKTATKMKCMGKKKKAGFTGFAWADYKTNTEIAKELHVTPVLDKKQEYRRNCLQHTNRMTHNRLPRILKNYSPTDRRNQGRLLDVWDWNGSTSGQDDDDNDDDEKEEELVELCHIYNSVMLMETLRGLLYCNDYMIL